MSIDEIKVEQGSKEWLEIRKKYLTATDIVFLKKTFFDKEKYYGKSFEDFFSKKHDKQEKRNPFSLELMHKGRLTEEIARGTVEGICECLSDSTDNVHKYTFSSGEVYTKDNWALASLDYALYKDGKIHAPLEVKYTEFNKTFDEYKTKTHINIYQLAFQMYVTGCSKGVMLIYFKDDNYPTQININTESEQYKNLLEMIKDLKCIHEKTCIEKVNYCEDNLSLLKEFGSELISTSKFNKLKEEEIHCLKNALTDIESKIQKLTEEKSDKEFLYNSAVKEEADSRHKIKTLRDGMCKKMQESNIHVLNDSDFTHIFRKVKNPNNGFTVRIENRK